MISTVFFDLDGTLTDSRRGILMGMAHAMTALGHPTLPDEVPTAVIGPPLYDSFRGLYGLEDGEARRGVALYRAYYGEEGIFENDVYDGVIEMLRTLRAAGLTLAIATGKPHPYARRISVHFGLDPYLSAVFGAEFDGTRGDKADLLAYAMGELGISPENAVMVGDRSYDIKGALAVGITPIGVLWGYGDRAELSEAGGRLFADRPQAVCDILRNMI